MKLATAVDKLIFMTDSTDHVAGKTGLTLTITASKAGGAFAAITPTVTERGNGWYSLALTTGHTDTLGDLGLHITATGADPTDLLWEVTPEVIGQLADGAVTAAKLADNSIDAATFAADVATLIRSYLGLGSANLDSQLSGISSKTTNLPGDPADQSSVEAAITAATSPLATSANLAIAIGYIDTEIAAILADTNELQTDWHNDGRLDVLLDAAAGGGGAFYESMYDTSATVVVCAAAASDVLRAAALRAAVTAAAALSPTDDKRITVIVPPGRYDFATGDGSNNGLILDTEFVDLQGATGNPADVILTSQIATASKGTVQQTANSVWISDLSIELDAASDAGSNATANSAYFPADNLPLTRLTNLRIYTWGTHGYCTRSTVDYAGRYTDIDVYGYRGAVFGGGIGGDASGEFIRCRVHSTSVDAGSNFGVSTSNGRFFDCVNIGGGGWLGFSSAAGYYEHCINVGDNGWGAAASGVLKDCVNIGNQGFGTWLDAGVASGWFIDCINYGTKGFGAQSTGTFHRCINAGDKGFGGTLTSTTGAYIECVGGADSFNAGTAAADYIFCISGGVLLHDANDANIATWLGSVPKVLTTDGRVQTRSLPTQSTIGGIGFQFALQQDPAADKLVSGAEQSESYQQVLDCQEKTTTYSPATTGSQWQLSVIPLSHEPVGEDPAVTFATSNPAIATVDGTGFVEYQGEGTCTITATSEETPTSPSQKVFVEITNVLTAQGAPYDVIEYIPDALDASKHILIIYNADSTSSVNLKDYYIANRPGMSTANLLGLTDIPDATSTTSESVSAAIVSQTLSWLTTNEATKPIRYIIILRGIPSRRSYHPYPYSYSSTSNHLSTLRMSGTGDFKNAEIHYNRAQFRYRSALVCFIDCGSYAATEAYIDKLKAVADDGGLQPDGLTISGAAYSGDQWWLDDTNTLYPESRVFSEDAQAIEDEGVNPADIHYEEDGPPLIALTDPTFFGCWGKYIHGSNWPITDVISLTGKTTWWIGMSVESFNGQYNHATHGDPADFFHAEAFFGTAYSHTPVGFVCHTDEPGLGGIHQYAYAARWARGWNFAECAWCGQNTYHSLAVGDPLVTR